MKICRYTAVVAAVLATTPVLQAQEAQRYRLGVQDRLRVHVHEWPMVTGEFVIGADGALVLPLVGPIPASGLDLSEMETQIANRLRDKAGLTAAPETTVDVAQYRPFYILGGVERPGEYHYRPGMLVVNAVAIAGGLYRPPRTSDWSFERDAITARGDLRLANVRRDELSAREIRLRAEAEGLEAFPTPPPDTSPGLQKFIEEERLLFSARFDRYRNQYASLGEAIELLDGEIGSLQSQIEAAGRQESSVARELEDTKGLVSRNILPAPRILPIERTLAQIQREKKEIDTSIMRARQQINQAKIQRESLKDERRSTALTELQAVEAQRKELNERIETSSRLASGSNSMLSGPQEAGESDVSASFVIIRQQDGSPIQMSAVETTVLQPGDIVKVFRPQDVSSTHQSADGRGDRRQPVARNDGRAPIQ